jgi:hypothetical protein
MKSCTVAGVPAFENDVVVITDRSRRSGCAGFRPNAAPTWYVSQPSASTIW